MFEEAVNKLKTMYFLGLKCDVKYIFCIRISSKRILKVSKNSIELFLSYWATLVNRKDSVIREVRKLTKTAVVNSFSYEDSNKEISCNVKVK